VGTGVTYAPFRTTANGCPYRPVSGYTVDMTTDENDGECVLDCSLRDAIIAANRRPGIITLGVATYTLSIAGRNEDDAATGDLDITSPLTITGAGPDQTFIDANGIDRVFDLRPGAGTVVISGVTISNGQAESPNGPGGGIFNWDADLILVNTVVQGNSAYKGGGVYVKTGSMTMYGGQITSNSANYGGGVFVEAGATFRGGQISDNSADIGGGVYVAKGSATLTGLEVVDNAAELWGGGVHVASGSATLNGLEVVDNTATTWGGGVHVGSGSATLDGGRILRNSANSGGGGLYLQSSSGQLTVGGGCIVNNSDTSAVNASGGTLAAILVWWGSASGPSGQGPGVGDSVGADVIYAPFSTTANGCPPRANFSIYLPAILRD
jgi:CSLREA domain-containing protein